MLSPNPIGGLSFRLAAVLICTTCLFYMAVMRSYNKKRLRGRLFVVLLVLTLIDCFTGITSTLISYTAVPYDVKNIVTYVCKFIYYLTHMAFTPVIAIYIMIVSDVFHFLNKVTLTVFVMPFLLLELAVLTNPFTGFIFSQSDNLYYSRGRGVYIAYTISAIYVLFCAFLMVKYWRNIGRIQMIALFYFLGIALIGTLVQMIFPEIVCELMAEALGLMGVLVMIERDDYRLDYKTRANNRASLIHDLKSYIEYGRHFYIICVRIDNAEIYRRIMGSDVYDFILAKGADYIRATDPRYEIYRTTAGNFFMLCPEASEADVDKIISKLGERLDRGFSSMAGPSDVKARILCGRCPEDFQDVDDILLLADTEIQDTSKIVFKGKDLDFIIRKVEVERAIVRGLNGDSFEVKYQPVYVKETGAVLCAEALLTLNDELLGEIEFPEFMKVSEETGFVEELEYRMIDSVCEFIKDGIEVGNLNLDVIIVHIMSVQVLKTDLVERVRKSVEKHGIDPSKIVFSISDNIALQVQDVLVNILEEFEKIGVKCALSNHNSGLVGISNNMLDKIIGVSIDIRRYYESTDVEQADVILKNRIEMIRQLGKTVIINGIDSEKYFVMLKEQPVDLMFGDYLSRRVDKHELAQLAGHKALTPSDE